MRSTGKRTVWALVLLLACGGEDPTGTGEVPDVAGDWSAAIVGTLLSTGSASVDGVITVTLTQEGPQFTGSWSISGTATLNGSPIELADGGLMSGFVLSSGSATVNVASGACPQGMQLNGTGAASELRLQGSFVVRQSCNGVIGTFTGALVFLRP